MNESSESDDDKATFVKLDRWLARHAAESALQRQQQVLRSICPGLFSAVELRYTCYACHADGLNWSIKSAVIDLYDQLQDFDSFTLWQLSELIGGVAHSKAPCLHLIPFLRSLELPWEFAARLGPTYRVGTDYAAPGGDWSAHYECEWPDQN